MNTLHHRGIAKFGVLLLVVTLFTVGLAFFSDGRIVRADNSFFSLTPGTPFTQNWSNPALITVNNDWSGVPSIQGFLGDTLVDLTPGADPQTVTEGFTTLSVLANTTPGNGTGGVGEMDALPNPVVALQGSGNADAPNLDISLNTTGCAAAINQINVAYNVRDIDSSTDNAVQQVALQYKIGAFGGYTNLSAGYIPDATTGPSQATLVSPIATNLPASAKGQPEVRVRIITSNASGNDEWVGIDDINITCQTVLAGGAMIRGRVSNAGGRGVMGVVVTLTGGTFLQPVYARTNPFGYYTFVDIPTGHAYVVSVSSKSLYFPEPSRIVSLDDNVSDIDFIAGQGK